MQKVVGAKHNYEETLKRDILMKDRGSGNTWDKGGLTLFHKDISQSGLNDKNSWKINLSVISCEGNKSQELQDVFARI
jgi:hypothetical protein